LGRIQSVAIASICRLARLVLLAATVAFLLLSMQLLHQTLLAAVIRVHLLQLFHIHRQLPSPPCGVCFAVLRTYDYAARRPKKHRTAQAVG
jgi:hypothetical protein